MSSGSSNIDPAEFNEPRVNNSESLIHVPNSDDENSASHSQQRRRRSIIHSQTRRFRPRLQGPPPGTPYRIWIHQPLDMPRPNRNALNRIIFSIARALRTRRNVTVQPGLRPGVIYQRNGNYILLDIQEE